MSTRRIYAVFLRQMYLLRGNPVRWVQLFVWAVIDIILWGFITKYLNAVGNASFSFVPVLLGAVVLWDFLSRVQQGVTMPFLEDVWAKNFLNIFASPLKVSEYILGFVVSSVFTSAAGLVAMVVFAGLFFGFSVFMFGALLLPFLLILFLFGVTLGIIGAAIVLRFGPAAEWLVWPIPTILSPFVGVFYPVATLPGWMQVISKALPPAYVFEGMRSALMQGTVSLPLLWWGIVLALLYVLLAYGIFFFVYRVVVRNGLIARFEAEGP